MVDNRKAVKMQPEHHRELKILAARLGEWTMEELILLGVRSMEERIEREGLENTIKYLKRKDFLGQ